MLLTLSLCAITASLILIIVILWSARLQKIAMNQSSETAQSDDNKVLSKQLQTKALFFGCFGIMFVSLFIYLANGTHHFKDYSYGQNVKNWTQILKTNPEALPPVAVAAVLRQDKNERVNDYQYWLFLGRMEMLAENNYAGAVAFERARTLRGKAFEEWSELGEALTFVARGEPTKDALAAFEMALTRDPKDTRALYYQGKFALSSGDYSRSEDFFLRVLGQLSKDDTRISVVEEQLKKAQAAQKTALATNDRIGVMVSSLELKLKDDPDNVDGWARLIRSYRVLKLSDKERTTTKAMYAHFKDRPASIKEILDKAKTQVGSENVG